MPDRKEKCRRCELEWDMMFINWLKTVSLSWAELRFHKN